jgi:hypothetical protein
MLVFAGAHVYWGFGGTAVLPDGVSVIESLTLFVVDLVAIPLCLAGAALAWALRPAQRPSRLAARTWLLWPARVGAAMMLAHGLTGLVLLAAAALGGGVEASQARFVLVTEPYWLLGGVLLAAAARTFRLAGLRAQSLQRKRREARALAASAQTSSTSHSPSRA